MSLVPEAGLIGDILLTCFPYLRVVITQAPYRPHNVQFIVPPWQKRWTDRSTTLILAYRVRLWSGSAIGGYQ